MSRYFPGWCGFSITPNLLTWAGAAVSLNLGPMTLPQASPPYWINWSTTGLILLCRQLFVFAATHLHLPCLNPILKHLSTPFIGCNSSEDLVGVSARRFAHSSALSGVTISRSSLGSSTGLLGLLPSSVSKCGVYGYIALPVVNMRHRTRITAVPPDGDPFPSTAH